MSTIHDSIGGELQGFGGLLRCTVCGREQPLGDVGPKLRNGWPKCHGYTMRWVTQRQLDEELGEIVPKQQRNSSPLNVWGVADDAE